MARRRLRIGAVILSLALLGGGAWGHSAWQLRETQREADAGRLHSAWDHLTQARRTWPLTSDAHLLAARIARRLGKLDDAKTHLAALGTSETAWLETRLLEAQDGGGREEELFALVEAGHPDSAFILEAVARGCLKTQNGAALQRALQLWPDRLVISSWRGQAYYRLGRLPEAVADLRTHLDDETAGDDVVLQLAQALYQTGYPAEGADRCRGYLAQKPQSVPALIGLALCLQDLGDFTGAAARLDDVLARDPQNISALIERGRVALRLGQPADGERFAQRAIGRGPESVDAHLVLAECLAAQGRESDASEERRRWQIAEAARYHLGLVLPETLRSPHDAELRYQAGSCFLILGDRDRAQEEFAAALAADPRHKPTHRALAEYYGSIGDTSRAADHRTRADAP
jgi:tetratricopeptide (TPR) repeat protein